MSVLQTAYLPQSRILGEMTFKLNFTFILKGTGNILELKIKFKVNLHHYESQTFTFKFEDKVNWFGIRLNWHLYPRVCKENQKHPSTKRAPHTYEQKLQGCYPSSERLMLMISMCFIMSCKVVTKVRSPALKPPNTLSKYYKVSCLVWVGMPYTLASVNLFLCKLSRSIWIWDEGTVKLGLCQAKQTVPSLRHSSWGLSSGLSFISTREQRQVVV